MFDGGDLTRGLFTGRYPKGSFIANRTNWGSQIRSYVLDDARIKDLRTSVETRNTQAVLDGKLDQFIVASLKAGL